MPDPTQGSTPPVDAGSPQSIEEGKLVDALLERLQQLQNLFQANMAKRARQFGFTATQAAVAQDLGQNPGSTLQDVCRRLGWPKSTVSRVVDDLVRRGIALREIPESNRRTILLSLDEAALGCVPSDFTEVFPGGLPEEPREIRTLIDSLDRLLRMMKERS
jgi:DNA-binding MarR family transcriptional regulator